MISSDVESDFNPGSFQPVWIFWCRFVVGNICLRIDLKGDDFPAVFPAPLSTREDGRKENVNLTGQNCLAQMCSLVT